MLELLELGDGLKLLLAALAGAIVGLERHIHGRAAGVRTNMLVAVAAALIMVVSEKYYLLMADLDPAIVRVDPSRIAAGAITGVGFLGAGVIIKNRASVVGLTTAATVWLVSAIGLALGAGMYALAGLGVALSLFALFVMDFIAKRIPEAGYRVFQVSGKNLLDIEPQIIELFTSRGFQVKSRRYYLEKATNRQEIDFQLRTYRSSRARELVQDLMKEPEIETVTARRQLLDD